MFERGNQVPYKNELFNVLTLAEAMETLRPYMQPFYERQEEVSLEKSWGRIAARDIIASWDLPHFRKSTVDGLAVRSADTFGANDSLPALIINIGEVLMGRTPSKPLGKGEGMLIPTGGMIPEEADAVVMIEHVENFGDSLYGVSQPVAPGENLIDIGEDITVGKVFISRFFSIRPQEMGLLAAQGIVNVPVIVRWNIGILSTGDEIVAPEIEPNRAQTRDINGYALMGQAISCGCNVKYYGIVGDDEKELRERLKEMLAESDIIILSGGSSVGTRDLTAGLIQEISETDLLFHGLALRPGKPTIAGVAQGKVIFGLPGHPVSAMVVFDNLIRPWLDASTHIMPNKPSPEGILTQNIYSGSGREEFLYVSITPKGDDYLLNPVRGKSGLISTMVQADGLVHISLDNEGLEADKRIKVRMLR